MSLKQKFIVLRFRRTKLGAVPGEMRQASNEASAIRIAENMSSHVDGVAAIEVLVDMESGEMFSPRTLFEAGTVCGLDELAAA